MKIVKTMQDTKKTAQEDALFKDYLVKFDQMMMTDADEIAKTEQEYNDLAEQIKELTAKKKALAQKLADQKQEAIKQLNDHHLKSYKLSDGRTMSIRKGSGKTVVLDDSLIPVKYVSSKPYINKSMITADLKRGMTVAGAELVVADSLQIKGQLSNWRLISPFSFGVSFSCLTVNWLLACLIRLLRLLTSFKCY